jgi:actin related protein 2/3 complex subunit 2
MILLEPGNRILEETVASKINAEEKREPCDVRLCDFDDVSYRVVVADGDTDKMQVAINMPCWREIEDLGGKDAVKQFYGDVAGGAELDGYDVTLNVDMNSIKDKPDLIKRLSLLKTNLLGGIFNKFFTSLESGACTGDNCKFALRSDTIIYILPGGDRCTVIFAIDFNENTDNVIARIFLQEFVETRRRLGAAPPVLFLEVPPQELRFWNITEKDNKLGYVSFAFEKGHVDRGKKDRAVATIQGFRTYLHYHLKCAKSFFHSRMRSRCVALLQVLNRAKNESAVPPKAAKTMSGKIFKRT